MRAGSVTAICLPLLVSACSIGGEYGRAARTTPATNASHSTRPFDERLYSVKVLFPWPPPEGSDEIDITNWVQRSSPKPPVTLADVDAVIRNGFSEAAPRLRYLSTPSRDGFAAVSDLESISPDGGAISQTTIQSGSLFDNFIGRPEGLHRIFVITVTGEDTSGGKSAKDIRELAEQWRTEGYSRLRDTLASRQLPIHYSVVVRLYLARSRGSTWQLVTRGDSEWRDVASSLLKARIRLGAQ